MKAKFAEPFLLGSKYLNSLNALQIADFIHDQFYCNFLVLLLKTSQMLLTYIITSQCAPSQFLSMVWNYKEFLCWQFWTQWRSQSSGTATQYFSMSIISIWQKIIPPLIVGLQVAPGNIDHNDVTIRGLFVFANSSMKSKC